MTAWDFAVEYQRSPNIIYISIPLRLAWSRRGIKLWIGRGGVYFGRSEQPGGGVVLSILWRASWSCLRIGIGRRGPYIQKLWREIPDWFRV